jgi:hypothetical protein
VPRPAVATIAVVLLIAACGARTSPASNGDGFTLSDGGDEQGTSGPCRIAGARVCGGGCPSLSDAECPGGCTAAHDRQSKEPLGVRLCWSDLKTGYGVDACDACRDGDVCIQRDRTRLVCAPESLCAGLWGRGATTGCRYADKTLYDGSALLASPSTCATKIIGGQCGGGCGPCAQIPTVLSGICTGRSATRSVGVCSYLSGGAPGDPRAIHTCAWQAGKWLRTCPSTITTGSGMQKATCLVFDAGIETMTVASLYGLCVPASVCSAIQLAGDTAKCLG